MVKFPITRIGFDRLEQEIKDLKYIERPKIITAISTARDFGDLSENAEYHSAREKQSFIEGRIIDLEDKLSRAEIIDVKKLTGDTVKFGSKVTLIDDETDEQVVYHIVGEYEADVAKKRISIVSPIARALIGKSVKDIVEVFTPGGVKSYEVVKVIYQDID